MDQILAKLSKNPIDHCWAIQDLREWPQNSKIHWKENAKGLSYVHFSGHPAPKKHPLLLLQNQGGEIESLLEHLPEGPFVIRETPASLLPILKARLPAASFYLEQRMITDRASFRPVASTGVRRLVAEDALALCEFTGAPPFAVGGMRAWVAGAVVMGVFEGGRIASLATTVVRNPEVWMLAGIETKLEFRGRGLATLVTSAITTYALEFASTVSLTVLKDNQPAHCVYEKLGFRPREDQIWVDNGAGSKP